MTCAKSHKGAVPVVTMARRPLPYLRSSSPLRTEATAGPREQSRALFCSPLRVNNGIKGKLLPRREIEREKKKEHFKRMKNFTHKHFLFRPEFMNFNQINTGRLGINIWTIMQNRYYGCNEN